MDEEPKVPQGPETIFTDVGEVTQCSLDATLPSGIAHDQNTIAFAGSGEAGLESNPAARRPVPAIPGYEIRGELGRGAMGVVYLARQTLLNRDCALKMILAGDHASSEAAVRFLAEAAAVARLQHPNVVQIHHIGEVGGLPYFELEYCAGGSLDKALDGTPRPPRAAAALVEGLSRGVAEAHRLGLVHRDLKPANVLLGADGTPKVTDFGLVKIVGSDPGLTRTNSILGSPSYMAPEQANGLVHEVGPRADVYSLGAILYELLTGRPPFRGATILETLQQVKEADPVAPSRLVPGLPRDIETIALKCLEKEPSRRYADASALAEDLRRSLDGEPILARPSLPWERMVKWARRRPTLAAMIAAIQALLVALLITGAWSYAEIRKALDVAKHQRAKAEAAGAKEATARRAAEIAGAGEAVARSEAEASAKAAVAETSRALLSETRALRLSHEAGWRDEAMKNLGRLAATETPTRDLLRLRTEAVACLGEPDARPLAGIGSGNLGVWFVEFSPDGKVLAINDDQKAEIHLWDITARRPIRDIPKASGFAPFALHPDGSSVALGASGNRVVFEPMTAGVKVPPPLAGPSPAIALAFDRSGGRLAVAWSTTDGPQGIPSTIERIVVHDVASGSTLRTILGPFDSLNYKVPLALSPDGSMVAAMGPDHQVQIWKVAGEDKPTTLGRHLSQVEVMAFSPDGASLATAARTPDPVVKVWDVAAGHERLALHGHSSNVWDVAFSPDGATLASAGNDLTVRFWDARDGRPRLVAPTSTGTTCLSLAFAPDGRRVAVGGQIASLIELEGFDTRRKLAGHDNAVFALAFRPNRAELASGSLDNTVIIWNFKAGARRMLRLADGVYPHRLAYSPDGSSLVFGPAGGRATADPQVSPLYLRAVDTDATKVLTRLRGPVSPTEALAFDRQGSRLASGHGDGSATAWDVATGKVIRQVVLGGPVRSVAFLPAERDGVPNLFAATDGGRLVTADLVGGAPRVATIAGNPGTFAVSPAGDRVAAGSFDGSLRLFRLPDLAPLATEFAAHSGRIWTLAFHPGGRLLASAGIDRRVIVRDAGTLRPLFEFAAPMATPYALAFSPDGASLAFSGSSEDITVWDFGQVLSRLDALGLGVGTAPSTDLPTVADRLAKPTPWVSIPQTSTVPIAALKAGVRLSETADALERWIENNPDDHEAWTYLASVRARANDRDGYDRHRRRILAKFEKTPDPQVAERMAKACLLRPGDADELEQAARLAGKARAVANQAGGLGNYYLFVSALARYRLGEFDVADRELRGALAREDTLEWNLTIPAHYVRAMVLARLGRLSEARSGYARGLALQSWMPAPLGLSQDGDGHDQRICELLRLEAEALLFDEVFPAEPFAR